jgi:hypothetical protein
MGEVKEGCDVYRVRLFGELKVGESAQLLQALRSMKNPAK